MNEDQKIQLICKLSISSVERAQLVWLVLGFKPSVLLGFTFSDTNAKQITELEKLMSTLKLLRKIDCRYELYFWRATNPASRKTSTSLKLKGITVAIGLTDETVKNIGIAYDDSDDIALGKLLGYPDTAVKNFTYGNKQPVQDMLDKYLPNDEIKAFIWFRPSEEHIMQEVESQRLGVNTLKTRAPKLYAEIVKCMLRST